MSKEKIAVFIMLLATLGTIAGVNLAQKYRLRQFYSVELIARAPDNGNWYPREIKVPLGKEVKLYIRNIETVTHGFAIPEFNVSIPEIKAGHVETVNFTPDKKGTFPFMCTVWCSKRHLEMHGNIVVE